MISLDNGRSIDYYVFVKNNSNQENLRERFFLLPPEQDKTSTFGAEYPHVATHGGRLLLVASRYSAPFLFICRHILVNQNLYKISIKIVYC
jgi:hypothetical protein